MKGLSVCAILIVSVVVFVSCGTPSKQIKSKSISERAGIFSEVREDEPVPQGYAHLIIKAHIKTHLEGYSLLESEESPHGKPEYPFLLNIDGQVITWKSKGVKEITPEKDWWGKITPEGGKGMRYELNKKIRLRPGSHTVFFVLPAEDYMKEVVITLEEGKAYVLEFRPIYNIDVMTYKIRLRIPLRNFMYEFKECQIIFDEISVRQLEKNVTQRTRYFHCGSCLGNLTRRTIARNTDTLPLMNIFSLSSLLRKKESQMVEAPPVSDEPI